MSRLSFVTPTHRADLERFALQRRTIEAFAPDIPHIAVVNDEDVALFRQVPYRRNLTVLSTRDILPRHLERRRTSRNYPRCDVRYWLSRRHLSGWWAQQLIKLATPLFIPSEGIVCLDSDTIFIKPVSSDDFYTDDGRLFLFETDDGTTITTVVWLNRAMQMLGISTDRPVENYIYNPVPMHRQVLLDLHRYIETCWNRCWMDVVLQHDACEYATYGAFARHINRLNHLALVRPALTANYWLSISMPEFANDFSRKVNDPHIKALNVQSHTGLKMEEYAKLIEELCLIKAL